MANTCTQLDTLLTLSFPAQLHALLNLSSYLDPATSADEIRTILSRIQGSGIYNHVISFLDGTAKANWTMYPDISSRHTFSHFWKSKRKNIRLGLFSTWTTTWVGKESDEWHKWHCWAVAIIKGSTRQGLHLIIWDCDPQEIDNRRPHQFLLSMQLKFLQFAQQNGKIKTLWYNQDTKLSGHDRCLTYSVWWIKKVAAIGDVCFSGRNDSRIEGCELVLKML
ncbi:hypothetical protein V8E54_002816 [Elaphomyces granulatus]|jgi:hypothetical protein